MAKSDIAVSVTGVRETLRTLRKVDEKAYWYAINEMKKAAEPLKQAIDGNFPADGPSGFQHNGRTGWDKQKPTVTQYGGRASGAMRSTGTTPLLRVKVVDAPRQIFDMAGARTPGNKLDRGLQKAGYGPASRAVWRTSDQTRRLAADAVTEAMRKVQAWANRSLTVLRPGG